MPPWAHLLLLTSCTGRFDYPRAHRNANKQACQEFSTEFKGGEQQCPDVVTKKKQGFDAPKDSSASVCAGYTVDHQNRLRLSLINRLYMDCSSWCVYDITDNASTAFQWSSSDQCYEPVTQWLCFEAAEERAHAQKKMENLCNHAKYEDTCEHGLDKFLETDFSSDPCLDLLYIDPVNTPQAFNQRLRCRCSRETKGREGNVIRTADTAVHCSEPRWSETTIRIERALLNGMYKSCENWCLFDIYEPDTRYWTWSPFGECWDDSGEDSVCDKLVRNYGEELQFAQKRAKMFCGDLFEPHVAFSWHTGEEGASQRSGNCHTVCKSLGQKCYARAMVEVSNHAEPSFTREAFRKAGVECKTISGGDNGITGTPAVDIKSRHCVTTAGSSEDGLSYCSRSIAGDFSRLCACSQEDATQSSTSRLLGRPNRMLVRAH